MSHAAKQAYLGIANKNYMEMVEKRNKEIQKEREELEKLKKKKKEKRGNGST